MICPGAKTCHIYLCYHAKEHEHIDGCENGCFGNTGCVKEKEDAKGRKLMRELHEKM